MKYDIAEHFSMDARRAAARALYVTISFVPGGMELRRTVIERSCPIGVMLLVDGHPDFGGNPMGAEVGAALTVRRLYAVRRTLEEQAAIASKAREFIYDWGAGRITDLYEALDVPRLGA